jgi:ketosteroid isomerase-like protein
VAPCAGSRHRAGADLSRQRDAVDAFLAAARGGDFDALVAVLDPDAVLRADTGTSFREVHGAAEVAAQALTFQRFARYTRPTLINGAAGVVTVPDLKPTAVMGLTIINGKIVEMDILADPDRLRRLDWTILDD